MAPRIGTETFRPELPRRLYSTFVAAMDFATESSFDDMVCLRCEDSIFCIIEGDVCSVAYGKEPIEKEGKL